MGILDDLKKVETAWWNIPKGTSVIAVNEEKGLVTGFVVDLRGSNTDWVDDEPGEAYRRDDGWDLYTTEEIVEPIASEEATHLIWIDPSRSDPRIAVRESRGYWRIQDTDSTWSEPELRKIINNYAVTGLKAL